MKTVLIAVAGRHGATEEIAGVLRSEQTEAEVEERDAAARWATRPDPSTNSPRSPRWAGPADHGTRRARR